MTCRETVCRVLLVVTCAAAFLRCAGGAGTGGAKESQAQPPAESPAPPAQAANDRAQPAQPAPTPSDLYDPATATGAVRGIPAPTNTAPIEAVANFFTELPGFDLAGLDPAVREKFLHRVNSELCTCGCKNDTIAYCLVNDASCATVKGLAQKILDEVKSGS